MNEWMNECANEWTSEWVNVWTNEWMNVRMSEWTREWMSEWMNDWMNERVNEWANEGMNEWMNEWMKEWMADAQRSSRCSRRPLRGRRSGPRTRRCSSCAECRGRTCWSGGRRPSSCAPCTATCSRSPPQSAVESSSGSASTAAPGKPVTHPLAGPYSKEGDLQVQTPPEILTKFKKIY